MDIFTKLRFNKYIDRFKLRNEEKEVNPFDKIEIVDNLTKEDLEKLIKKIKENKSMIYYLGTIEEDSDEDVIKRKATSLSVIVEDKVYYLEDINIIKEYFKEIFEDEQIGKIGYKIKQDYIILKQNDIEFRRI